LFLLAARDLRFCSDTGDRSIYEYRAFEQASTFCKVFATYGRRTFPKAAWEKLGRSTTTPTWLLPGFFPFFPFFTSVFDIDLDAPRCTVRLNQTLYAQRSGGIFSNDFIGDSLVSRRPTDRAGFLALRDRVWRVFISRHLTGKELDGLACLRVD